MIGPDARTIEFGQHPKGESCGTHAAAGERQPQQYIVGVSLNFSPNFIVGQRFAERNVARQIVDRRTSRQHRRQRDHHDDRNPRPHIRRPPAKHTHWRPHRRH
jgi:hypothetical protein